MTQLRGVRVENFKPFVHGETLISPITLLHGVNAAGKSSLFQGVLALRQTLEHDEASDLLLDGPLVALGGFRNAVRGQVDEPGAEFKLGVTLSIDHPTPGDTSSDLEPLDVEVLLSFQSNREDGTARHVGTALGWKHGNERVQLTLRSGLRGRQFGFLPADPDTWPPAPLVTWLVDVCSGQRTRPLWTTLGDTARYAWGEAVRAQGGTSDPSGSDRAVADLTPDAVHEALEGWLRVAEGRQPAGEPDLELPLLMRGDLDSRDGAWLPVAPITAEDPKHAAIAHVLVGFCEAVRVGLRGCLREISYVGPYRRPPARLERLEPGRRDVGAAGEHLASVLAALEVEERERLGRALAALELGYTLSLARVESGAADLADRYGSVRVDADTLSVAPRDVGYGVSQILPVLVAAVVAGRARGTLIVEEPELHLHPQAQASLLQALRIASNDDAALILETHSEIVFLTARIAARRGQEDIGVVAVISEEGAPAVVSPGPVGEDGWIAASAGPKFSSVTSRLIDELDD